MYTEDDLLPISAIQHLMFCERQCALNYVDQQWSENRLTAEGRVLHERVHEAGSETRSGVRIARGVRLRSLALGLSGIADVVEFHAAEDGRGFALPGRRGIWRACPVEYKRGHSKLSDCDRVQVCAQALCLEEMLSCSISEAALFYGAPRRREAVPLTDALRRTTTDAALRAHHVVRATALPPPNHGPYCRSCSLADACLPKIAAHAGRVAKYLEKELRDISEATP